jgi:cystathionine gamma-synthase
MPGFDTTAIHAGQEPDPLTGAVAVPIYQTSTYKQDGVGGLRGGYEYSRSANPTRTALEVALAALEQGTRGLAFASGLAAEDTLLRTVCRPGDHVILPGDAYGGTFRLVARVLTNWGLEYTPVPLADLDAVRAALRENTRVIWCETPTNPLLGIADIAALAEIARAANAKLVVDNTFASPYLQQPITLGADVVVHSMTKYLGGHSDVVGGALITADDELGQQLAFHQNSMGAIAGPFDSWLVLRGIKTLGVRMDRHCSNAERVVDFLTGHPAVAAVLYPGLPEHPGHETAARQMRGFGGMVSFRLRGGEEAALKVCELVQVFTLGESLGGVESLIEHPGKMTHASVAGSPLEVPGDLVRLSVGIENVEDLLADLAQALARACPARHSAARMAKSSSVVHSPLNHSFSTRTASWRIPSRRSTAADFSLRASTRPTTRCRSSPSKASASSARHASVT